MINSTGETFVISRTVVGARPKQSGLLFRSEPRRTGGAVFFFFFLNSGCMFNENEPFFLVRVRISICWVREKKKKDSHQVFSYRDSFWPVSGVAASPDFWWKVVTAFINLVSEISTNRACMLKKYWRNSKNHDEEALTQFQETQLEFRIQF